MTESELVRKLDAVIGQRTTMVHTIVTHRSPDLEALMMLNIIARNEGLRRRLGIVEKPKFKYVRAGLPRAEDWHGEPANVRELMERGYLFVDCLGGPFDQHTAEENRGKEYDELASIDLLVRQTVLLSREPYLEPFVRLISQNDRRGESVVPKTVLDKASKCPHTPRDLRSMVVALNALYPEEPERVRELFFLAMDGLIHLFVELCTASFDATGQAVDETQIDLKGCYFLTVDLAAIGIERCLLSRFEHLPADVRANVVADNLARFWRAVEGAWGLAENEWKVAMDDYKRAKIRRAGGLRVALGFSSSPHFPVVARCKGANVTIQIYPDGRFLIGRQGDQINLDRVAGYLRLADAMKRGGWVREPKVLTERDTTSIVVVRGERILQFYYPNAGFGFGNRFRTNPDGLAVSPLTPVEIGNIVLAGLMGDSLEEAVPYLFGRK